MLHEILLSLSGHPSALFENPKDPSHVTSTSIALLSPPEAELLSSLGHLSRLHRRTRDHVAGISANHPSTICRAVATAIGSHHLDKFQQKVLDVENRILTQDASTVGAYNIVPLAGIVSEFSEWTKLMEWLWDITNLMMPPGAPRTGKDRGKIASGAELIDKLRTEAQTGYPDIEDAAVHLGAIAETSWLRQLASWLLYGRLPSFGASDFFISAEEDDELSFVINHKLLPNFVTRLTASSILFVGKSLNQIRSLPSSSKALSGPSARTSELDLLPTHVGHLSGVVAPISSAMLSEAVRNIRQSLSQNLLQFLLPREKIVEILTVLHQFFLLGRGEFAMALIAEADQKLSSRHQTLLTKSSQGIQGMFLKEGEINNALSRSWAILSSLGGEDDHTDDALDLAIDIVHLAVQTNYPTRDRPGTPGRAKEANTQLPTISNVVFADLLLSIPTTLTMELRSPLDLFMTKADLDIYSAINAYLLAVRRAHLHLAQLWRQSFIRREPPAPTGHLRGNKAVLAKRRRRAEIRSREMRKVWATCTAAIFFLSESEAYFQGEVVQQSYKSFLEWVIGSDESTAEDAPTSSTLNLVDKSAPSTSPERQQHDPEALSFAHRQFLSSICYSLLLTDVSFTKAIRKFFTHVDELVALITRLQNIRQNLDLEEDDGVNDFTTNYKQEEKQVSLELDRARRRMDSDMKSLIARLRDIDSDRVGSTPGQNVAGSWEVDRYEPLRVGGIDTLLMKLDWSSMDDEGDEENRDLV